MISALLTLQMQSTLSFHQQETDPPYLSSEFLVGAEYPALTALLLSFIFFAPSTLILVKAFCFLMFLGASTSRVHFFTISHTT